MELETEAEEGELEGPVRRTCEDHGAGGGRVGGASGVMVTSA